MKSHHVIIALIVSLAIISAGCGGRKGGAPISIAGAPSDARSAASGPGTNVTRVGSITGGAVADMFISGNYAYVAATNMFSIMDISNPGAPAQVAFYKTPANAVNVYVSGNYAYVAEGAAGFQIFNVANPANPTLAGSYVTTGSANHIFVSGNYAYVTEGATGLQIIDVTNPANPTLAGSYDTPGIAQGLYVSGNYAYVADGASGFEIINVTNPANPTLAASSDIQNGGNYSDVYVSGNYAYFADISAGLKIINITNPAHPAAWGLYNIQFGASHVYVSGNYAYLLGQMSGLKVINVTNPASPSFAGSFATTLGSGSGIKVSGNYVYESAGSYGFQIINVATPSHPTLTSSYKIPTEAYDVFISGNYEFMADGSSGLMIYDISNPASPTLVGSYDTPGTAQGVYVSGSYAYVGDNNSLQIINVSNPASPTLAGSYSTGYARSVYVSGNYAYLVGTSSSLTIINVSNPASPTLASSISTAYLAMDVYVSGNYAYLAEQGGNCQLEIINITNPASPTRAGRYPGVLAPSASAYSVHVSGNYAYLADGGLKIINVTNPASPALVGSYSDSLYENSVYVSGNYAYMEGYGSRINIINVANPASPILAGSYVELWGQSATSIFVSGSRAYTAVQNIGMFIYDFTGASSNNTPPVVSGCYFSPVSIAAGGTAASTLQCNVADANNNVSTVTVNLSAIGRASNAALTNTAGNTWQLTGITAPATATVRTNYLQITATDANGATATSQATLIVYASNPKPIVSGCGFAPNRLAAGGATTSMLQCSVTDANGAISAVAVDLSSIGGAAAAPMTNTGGNTWQRTGITAAANSTIGTNYPQITATDALGATGTSQATMIVYDPAPVVSGCAFAPNRIPAGGGTTSTLQCTVADPNNNVASVTVNLTSIGGSANAALTNTGGNTWRLAGITASAAAAQQTNAPTITATDAHAGTGTSQAVLIVYDPIPVVSFCAFAPVSIKANGIAASAVQCTVTDPNNNVTAVTVNLTAIGGPAAAALTNTTGNIWRLAGITAPIGTAAGTKYPTTTATDAHAGTGSQNATLIIAP